MKSILTDLYYGNLHPKGEAFTNDRETQELLDLICKHEDKLNRELPEELRETFEKYEDCCLDLQCVQDEQTFLKGFRLGVRIIVEAMSDE